MSHQPNSSAPPAYYNPNPNPNPNPNRNMIGGGGGGGGGGGANNGMPPPYTQMQPNSISNPNYAHQQQQYHASPPPHITYNHSSAQQAYQQQPYQQQQQQQQVYHHQPQQQQFQQPQYQQQYQAPPQQIYNQQQQPQQQYQQQHIQSQMMPAREHMQEVREWDDNKERTENENRATIYGFIRATEVLESIYEKDSCKEQEYLASCNKLISSFKSSLLSKYDAEQFFVEYNLKSECPRAYERLVRVGVPQAAVQTTNASERKMIAETTDSYITAMDALKLGATAKDALQPYIKGILTCLVKIPGLPADFAGKFKINQWLDKLDRMKANDDLSEEEVRQLLFDIETSYNQFHEFLAR